MTQLAPEARVAPRGRSLEPVLALDLGGTNLRTAVVQADGRLIGRRMSSTPRADAQALVEACVAQLQLSLADGRREGAEPSLLTISAPGPLDPGSGVLIDPPNLDRSLWDFPLASRLGEAVGLPALLERDTQIAALGEGLQGAAQGLSDYVYLTVSTGVGGAVVSAGNLLRGPDGVAGELGHLVVEIDGPPCGCGGRGHLEAFASGTGMAAAATRAWKAGSLAAGSPLARLFEERGPTGVGGREVAAAEEAGDILAAGIMDSARQAFAAAVVSIVDVFNPQRVVVGGGVATGQAERLLQPARDRVAAEAFRTQARRVEIVPAALGDDVCLLGGLGLEGLGSVGGRRGRMALAAGAGAHEQTNDTEDNQAGPDQPAPASPNRPAAGQSGGNR